MELLTTKRAAEYLSVSAAFLERDRWAGAQLPFVKIGSRTVRYLKEDLEEYVKSRRVTVSAPTQMQKNERSQAPSRQSSSSIKSLRSPRT